MDGGFRDERDLAQLRVPPQAIEAEQSVLGGLLLQPKAWFEVSDLLKEADFYRRDHQLIWRAIAALEQAGRPIDVVTVGDFLVRKGFGEMFDGGAYLVELASTTPSAANIRAYAELVLDKALLRRMIEAGTQIVNNGFAPDGRETLELIGEAQSAMGNLLEDQPCDLEDVGPVMERVFGRLTERYHRGGGIDGLTVGLDEWDRMTNGLKAGQVIVLAARPKMGKTTLAQNIAEHVAVVQRKPVAIFSFEMQPEELGERMLASNGDIDADRLRKGDLDDVDWSSVSAAIRRIKGAPLLVSRPKSARVEHVVAQMRRLHARQPLSLVVIDYLQLMETHGAENRTQGLAGVSRALKLAAGDLGVPILLLSQLNRDLEKRTDKRPVPADLRDSGAIEQDADIVVFIYRDEVYNRASPDRGTAELIFALQRNGPADTVRVRYRPDRFRFENLEDGWMPDFPSDEGDKPRRGFRKRAGNPGADAAAGDA